MTLARRALRGQFFAAFCSCDRRVKTDALVQFGQRVRQLRLEQNLSQEDLAELADLHRNYASQIGGGRRNVSLLNILKLALF